MLKAQIKMFETLEALIEEYSAFQQVGPIYRREVCAISPKTNWSCSSQHSSCINRSRRITASSLIASAAHPLTGNGSASINHQRGT
jgi:hypothetical protein